MNSKNDYSPSRRWQGLNADAAWRDIVRIYKETDKDKNLRFMASVESTLHMGADTKCGQLTSSNCVQTRQCSGGPDGRESGPAGQLIFNSLVKVHQMHADYQKKLFEVAGSSITNALDDLENKFAPVAPKEDNSWELLLINLLTLGTLKAAGPFFNSFLAQQAYFLREGNAAIFDTLKDTTMNLIGQSATIAKDLQQAGPERNWTAESKDSFSNYMGQVIEGWGNMTSARLWQLFDGKDESLESLWNVISDGKLVEGETYRLPPDDNPEPALRANIAKTFFGFAIPSLWSVSNAYSFVVDSGYDCDGDKPLGDYLNKDIMEAAGACFEGRQYYLAHPDGEAVNCRCENISEGACQTICRRNRVSVPPGLKSLDGRIFGGITKEDLIKGSVRTYLQNGKKNGGGYADVSNTGTIDNLLATDVTTPGFMRIPVCSPERAFVAWEKGKKGFSDNYPCDLPLGVDACGDSTFENQSSGGSPLVKDCQKLAQRLQANIRDWETDVVGKRQRKIEQEGSCRFGVEATSVDGNIKFSVGNQDIVDILNEAIKLFGNGPDSHIGAKGNMKCNGNIKQQKVKWGIY